MLEGILEKIEDHALRRFLKKHVSQRVNAPSFSHVSEGHRYNKRYVEGGALDVMAVMVLYGGTGVQATYYKLRGLRRSVPPETRNVCKKPEPCASDHLTIPFCAPMAIAAIPIGIIYNLYIKIFGKTKSPLEVTTR